MSKLSNPSKAFMKLAMRILPQIKARQLFGKPAHSATVSCLLLIMGLLLGTTFVPADYRAEAHVSPYTLHENVLRLPFSNAETLPQTQNEDTSNYVAGKKFRFSASSMPTETPPATADLKSRPSPIAAQTTTQRKAPPLATTTVAKGNQQATTSLANVQRNAFLKTYGLSNQGTKAVNDLTPKNTFLESLLTLDAGPSPYIQETNQCDPFDAVTSLLAFSHKTPGKAKAFNRQGQNSHYRTLAQRYAEKYQLPTSLVMAIIKAESNFNPQAVSSQQAIGLMQIVPSTAGEEVHSYLHGYSSTPAFETLFQPDSNILYGTTYLHLLEKRYFQRIEDQTSRQLCIIAAYNGGPGAVLRVFSPDMDSALTMINSMNPDEVYSALSTGMPFAESRNYIDLVLSHIRNF